MTFSKVIFALASTLCLGVSSLAHAGAFEHGTVITDQRGGTLGSYAQWTDTIAVTSAHVVVDDKASAQIDCVDVKFIARTGVAPKWAIPEVGDEVAAVGSRVANARIQPTVVKGAIQDTSLLVCDGGAQLLTFSGHAFEGMSGGPVYRVSDGAAVGITMGYLTEKADLTGSVMVPFHTIKAAWDFLQAQGSTAALKQIAAR